MSDITPASPAAAPDPAASSSTPAPSVTPTADPTWSSTAASPTASPASSPAAPAETSGSAPATDPAPAPSSATSSPGLKVGQTVRFAWTDPVGDHEMLGVVAEVNTDNPDTARASIAWFAGVSGLIPVDDLEVIEEG